MRGLASGILALGVAIAACPAAPAFAQQPPKLSVADASAAEGDDGSASLTFTAKLSKRARHRVPASYATSDGRATAPTDYAAAAGKVTIARRHRRARITVAVVGDAIPETDESLTLALSNPKHAMLADGSAEGIIRDDDFAGPPDRPAASAR